MKKITYSPKSGKKISTTLSFDPVELNVDEYAIWKSYCAKLFETRSTGELGRPFEIAEKMGLDLYRIFKESLLCPAIWVAFLTINADLLMKKRKKKYANKEEFLLNYPQFRNCDEDEVAKLFETANWMNIFFEYMPAKKNKGIIIQVIPKFLEGWHVKYVTGSGQTSRTKNRVLIYETEGNVKPFQRGTFANKKRSNTITSMTSDENDNFEFINVHQHQKKRKYPEFGQKRGRGRPRKESVKTKTVDEYEHHDSTEEESIDIDSNESDLSDYESFMLTTNALTNNAMKPIIQKFCSNEGCDINSFMPMLCKISSLDVVNFDEFPPLLQRFASAESTTFEACLASLRDDDNYFVSSSSNLNDNENIYSLTSLTTPNVYNHNQINVITTNDLEVPVLPLRKRTSKTDINPNSSTSLYGKNDFSNENKSSFEFITPQALSNDTKINFEPPVIDTNLDNDYLIPPILLRGISWGTINLSESSKDITKINAFPSPHSSFHPLDDLLFPSD